MVFKVKPNKVFINGLLGHDGVMTDQLVALYLVGRNVTG